LMREAAKAGARVLGGLSMLVYQGAIGFELWTGEKAPVQAMFKAVRQALNSSGA
jgi:shikimate dehydrogenase